MCGRFTQSSTSERYARLFGLDDELRGDLAPRFNVAPTQSVLACRIEENSRRDLAVLRWGLVPFWSHGPDSRYSMINARAETVHQKPAYRDAFRHRRCLIPADGFCEWTPQNGKQPYFIHRQNGEPMAFAGLWEHWKSEDTGEVIESCAIIVTDANELTRPIHDRMPVILVPGDFARWLETPPQEAPSLLPLLRSAPSDDLEAYPVSTAVNSPRHEGRGLIERLVAARD
jgi:putative SOS response-associated peptidase YedK